MSPVGTFLVVAWAGALVWSAFTVAAQGYETRLGRAAFRVLMLCLAVAVVAAMWGLTAALVQEAR